MLDCIHTFYKLRIILYNTHTSLHAFHPADVAVHPIHVIHFGGRLARGEKDVDRLKGLVDFFYEQEERQGTFK